MFYGHRTCSMDQRTCAMAIEHVLWSIHMFYAKPETMSRLRMGASPMPCEPREPAASSTTEIVLLWNQASLVVRLMSICRCPKAIGRRADTIERHPEFGTSKSQRPRGFLHSQKDTECENSIEVGRETKSSAAGEGVQTAYVLYIRRRQSSRKDI